MSIFGKLLKAGISSDGNMNKIEGIKLGEQVLTASGNITGRKSWIKLNSISKIAAVIATPIAGQLLIISQVDSGTAGHTVSLTSGTFDGSHDTATFDNQNETLVLFGVSSARYVIIENIGSVALS